MKHPLVSIIIPTYNYAHLIGQTIECLLKQSYQNWEAIIVDDGSTDNTKVIVQAYLSEQRIIYNYQDNRGLPAARNTGVENSNGKYIQFLDADDLISPCKIEKQVMWMEKYPQIDICYTNAYFFETKNPEKLYANWTKGSNSSISKLNGNGIQTIRTLIKNNIMPVNCALIRNSVFDKAGLQNEYLKSLEDWEFWLRCAFHHLYFEYIEDKDAYALIRLHDSSMSRDSIRMQNQELNVRALIENGIDNSKLLNEKQKVELKILNQTKKADSYRKIFTNSSKNQLNILKKIKKEFGLITTLRIYFKSLNDKRLGNRRSKN